MKKRFLGFTLALLLTFGVAGTLIDPPMPFSIDPTALSSIDPPMPFSIGEEV